MTRPIADLLEEAREEGARRERVRADLARETARERAVMRSIGAILQLVFWGAILAALGGF